MLTAVAGASITTLTTTAIRGYVSPPVSASLREQVAPAQDHPDPHIDTSVSPEGIFSVTVMVPVVGPAPVAFETAIVKDRGALPLNKGTFMDLRNAQRGRRTIRQQAENPDAVRRPDIYFSVRDCRNNEFVPVAELVPTVGRLSCCCTTPSLSLWHRTRATRPANRSQPPTRSRPKSHLRRRTVWSPGKEMHCSDCDLSENDPPAN